MIFLGLISLSFFIGVISTCTLSGCINRLLRDSETMETSKNTLFKQMRLRYDNSNNLGKKIINTQLFSEKYISKYKYNGMTLRGYQNMGIMSGMLCLMCGLIGAMLDSGLRFEYTIMGVISVIIIFFFQRILDLEYKKQLIVENLVEFFDARGQAMQATVKDDVKEIKEIKTKKEAPVKKEEREFSQNDRRLIEEILAEYLT